MELAQVLSGGGDVFDEAARELFHLHAVFVHEKCI
jgi:hypothetical protein